MINAIYKITNIINNKCYIGQTWKSLNIRFNQHIKANNNRYLTNAINKYGKENFKIELLTITHSQQCADFWEKYFITLYNSMDTKIGYNLKQGGSQGKLSKEVKEKISKSHIGMTYSEQTKIKLSEINTGELNSFYGKHHTDEAKQKIADARKGHTPWNKGKTGIYSEETLKTMSLSHRGQQTWLGKSHTEISKIKMSEAHKGQQNWLGKTHTEESKRKISEAQKKRFLDKKKEQL